MRACCVPVGQRVQPRVPRDDVGMRTVCQVRTGRSVVTSPSVAAENGTGRTDRRVRSTDALRHSGGRVPGGRRNVPVGGSASAGRNSRCTAARTACATALRTPGVEQQQPVDRVREVTAVEPDRRHPGHPQQVPGLAGASRGRACRCGRPPRGGRGWRTARRPWTTPRTRCRSSSWPPRGRAAEACASRCREMNRSARASLAKAVRSAERRVLVAPAGEVDRARPAAASRPSIREARSKTRSASVVSPSVKPGLRSPPWPGSTTIRRPIRCGPLVHERGALPQQLRPAADHLAAELAQRAQRGRAAGAVGGEPVVALEGAQARLGLGAEDAVDRAGVVAELDAAGPAG